MTIDELLKKSTNGAPSADYKKVNSSNILDQSRNGVPTKEWASPEPKTITPVTKTKEPFLNKVSRKIDNLTSRPEEGSARSQTMRGQLPSSFVENLPFGVGEIVKQARDEPSVVGNVNFEDVLGGIRDVSKGTFTGIIGTTASLYPKPLKFNIPGLGEVKNLEYNAAQRVASGENVGKVILEEGVVNNIFGVLMLAGLANEVAGARPTTIAKVDVKGPIDTSKGQFDVKQQPRSFRLYEEPTGTIPLDSATVQKLATERGVDLGPKYDPTLPTYFKMTGKATGVKSFEVVQVKPSYLQTFLNKLGMNINKVPNNMLEPLITQNVDTNKISKVDIVPEDAIVKPPIEQTKAVVENIIPKLENAVTNNDVQLVESVKKMAQETGDETLIKKVDNAISKSEEVAKKVDEVKVKMNDLLEKSTQTPEKQLSEPAYTPYTPARSIPAERVYANTPTSFFGKGTYEGKPYTTDSFILEFNSDVKAPKKVVENERGPAPDENAVRKIIPLEENINPVEITKVQQSEDGKQKIITLEGDGLSLDMQQKYFDYFSKKYPGATFEAESKTKPVVVYKGGEVVGLIMPMDTSGLKKLQTTWERPKVAQPSINDVIKNIKTTEKTDKIKEEAKIEKKLEKVKQEANQEPSPENTFVTVVNEKTGEHKVFRIKDLEFQSIIDKVDNMRKGEIAGEEMPNGDKYHITTKPLSSIKEKGFKYSGEITLKDLPKSKSPKLSNGALGSYASPQGSKTIRKILERQKSVENGDVQEVPKDFKISERAKAILEEFGVPIAERSLSNRLLGVYKPLTEKVRVQALYDITTVTHEAIHAIDAQDGFSQKLINDTGRGAKIRNRLTDIYEELYPKAQRTHKLDKRIKEGLAVLFENYFYDPASIQSKYPDLVDSFIKPTGEYYNPKFSSLLDKMNSLVDDYSKLTPSQRIGSRIRTGKEVVEQQKGFTIKQRLEYEIMNKFEPLKRYGKQAGVQGTWDDPLIQAFNIMNKNGIVASWVKGIETPILLRDGNFRIEKGTVKDYLNMVKGSENEFRSYLVARRVVADNNKLTALKNTLEKLQQEIIGGDEINPEFTLITDEIQKLQSTITKDDFSLQDASAVVEKYGEQFKDAEKMYDDINKRLIDFSEENDLIDHTTAEGYRSEKGYASFRRYIDEELASIGTIKTSSKSKVTSFKERTGSQLDIIDPIYSQITSINEIIGKGMENRLWNKVADLANKNPDIAQRFEKMESNPSIDAEGRISFPQEKDPGTIRIFRNGKREFYKIAPEFGSVMKTLRGKETDTFAQLLRIPASVFTRLTTSANPLFALGNLSVDQFSALAQTKTGFKPIVDPGKSLYAYVTSDEGMNAYIALGGKRQTLASFYDLSPEDIAHKLTGGETKVEKITGIIDSSIGILELPSNISEIMTRYSEFNRAIKEGDSMSVAMYKASEITTPFQLQGNFGGPTGQAINRAIPYFNATIQVLYKFARATKDNPKRVGTVTAGILAAGLTIAILTYKNASQQQKRLLAEQPTRNLSRYIYVPSPNGKDLIKFRIPEQMGILTGMTYLYAAKHYEGNKATFDDYVDTISAAIPEQVQVWNPAKMMISWMPQMIKPGIQVAFNKKTFPELAPIVPEYMLAKKPSEQYNAYTSKVSKTIGSMLNMSPTKVEFFIRNQFGVVGGLLVGKLPSDPLSVQEESYVMAGRSYNRFYDNKTLVNQQYQETVKNNPDKYSYEEKYTASRENKVYNAIADTLADMRKIDEKKMTENLKESMYQLLLKVDSSNNIEDVVPDLYNIKSQINTLQ